MTDADTRLEQWRAWGLQWESNGWRDKALELNEQRNDLLEMVKYLRNYARLADLAPDTAAKLDALIEKAENSGE